MSDGPWIKFYPADWLTGTNGLSPTERGIYITLIALMYEKDGALVLDAQMLARACGAPLAQFKRALDVLLSTGKVQYESGGRLTNKRVMSELGARAVKSATNSAAAKARWDNTQQNQPTVDADAMPKASHARTGQISDTRNQISEVLEPNLFHPTDNSNPVDDSAGALSSKATPTPKGTRLPSDWVLPKAWGDWALSEYSHLTVETVRALADNFRDYWIGVPGAKGRKTDWLATWRNRVRDQAPMARGSPRRQSAIEERAEKLREKIENEYGIGRQGSGDHGYAGGVGGIEPAETGEPRRLLPFSRNGEP